MRWLAAGAAVLLTGWTGVVPFGLGTAVAVGWAIASSALLLMRDRTNPGIAGFLSAIDSLAIFTLLSGASRLGSLGWLGALPTLYAVHQFRASSASLGAVNVGQMLSVHALVQGSQPSPLLYVQMAGVLSLGWVLKPISVAVPVAEVVGSTDPFGSAEPDSFLGLRESFRRLKTMYRNLEWQSRQDRVSAKLLDVRLSDVNFTAKLAERFREAVGADRALIYSAAADDSGFVPRAATGCQVPDEKLRLNLDDAVGRVRHRSEQAWALSGKADEGLKSIHVPLCHGGRIVGMGILSAPSDRAEAVQVAADEAASLAGALLVEAETRQREMNNVKRLELQRELARHMRGGTTLADLAKRFLEQVSHIFGFDHAAIRTGELNLATEGRALSFAPASEVTALAAFGDLRFEAGEMVKRRVGTLVAFTLGGYSFSFASTQEGRIDESDVEGLRELANDFMWATSTLDQPCGLVTPEQFKERMAQPGVVVLIEMTHRQSRTQSELEAITSRILDQTLRTLPLRAAILARADGDVLVHLPNETLGSATEWGTRAIHGILGVRLRTASLWPRTNAIIGGVGVEPEDLVRLSKE